MVNLLLLLLFMVTTTKEPELIIQNPQMEVMPTVIPDRITNIWRIDRPINARTGTINRYLDSATFNAWWTVSSMSLYDIDNGSITIKSWQLIWDVKSNWTPTVTKIYIPQQWTYQINWRVFISSWLWVSWLLTTFLQINESYAIGFASAIPVRWITIPITTTANINKWDYINVYLDNETANDIDFSIEFTITKLS